jgi:hypothetical protein
MDWSEAEEPTCHPKILYGPKRSEASVHILFWYFGGDRPDHKLPFGGPHIYNKSRSEWYISTQADDPIQPISTQPIFSHHLNVNTTKINILKHVIFFYVSLACYLLTYIDMGFPGMITSLIWERSCVNLYIIAPCMSSHHMTSNSMLVSQEVRHYSV